MAFLLLVLTVYPYLFNQNTCCSVSAYSSDDVELKHNSIEKFDIIKSNDIVWSKSISTRDTHKINEQLLHDDQNYNYDSNELDAISSISSKYLQPTRKVQFSSLGKKFDLILSKPSHLITNDFKVVSLDSEGKETIVPMNRDDIQILEGYVEGEPTKSRATASFDNRDKLMTAQIKTGQDTIIVEPSYLHKNNFFNPSLNSSDFINPKLYDNTMIVYNLSDHKQFKSNDSDNSTQFDINNLCASLNMNDYNSKVSPPLVRSDSYNPELDDVFKIEKPITISNRGRTKRFLDPYITAQERERKTRCTLHLVADYLFYKNVGNGDLQTTINYILALINRVNQIYLPTVWETGDDLTERFSNIGFTVQNITIHQEFTRLSSGDDHYNMQGDKIWAAREFLDNFSKYSPPRHYCLAHLLTYRQFDSPVLGLAYVASTRYGTIGGICSPTQQKGDSIYKHNTGISTSKGISGETLITRQADLVVAHELGHNLGAEHDSNDCRPPPSKGGAYLMHPFAVMGFEKNNRFLSNCSRISIGRVIKRKASTCFIGVVDHVCGNGIVEDDEECDGGDVGHDHNDPCCDSSCRFTPGSQCSDRHSWCCSKCHIVPAGKPCRPAEEYNCKQVAHCDGRSAECPASPPVEDNKVCVGRGLCRGGDCIPFCEARELHSCLCHNPADACKLCCKSSINGTCVPYDNRAPYLPDGLLCYRGVCRKGRCEQPVQDIVARLWGVIEDFNFTTLVKFLRDNIIFVVLVCSIPVWCIFSHYINEFDRKIKEEMVNAFMNSRRKNGSSNPSPFLPRLFVADDIETSNSLEEGLPMNEIKV